MQSIGGSVCSFSKFSDLIPVFTVCGTTITLICLEGNSVLIKLFMITENIPYTKQSREGLHGPV